MNFRLQRQILIYSTMSFLLLSGMLFTHFIHRNHEKNRFDMIENKLRGDAASILPHLYQSGNIAWFKGTLENIKQQGLPCLKITDLNGGKVWGNDRACSKTLNAKNYIDQKVFSINYDLPTVSVWSSIKANGLYFSILFAIQLLFVFIAFQLLSFINKKHADALIQIERIHAINDASEKLLKLTRTLSHNLRSPLSALKSLYELIEEKIGSEDKELLSAITQKINDICAQLIEQSNEPTPVEEIKIAGVISRTISIKKLEFSKRKNIAIESSVESIESCRVLANSTELSLIISNLINNSIEAEANHITVSADKGDDTVQIKIVDNGNGIPEENQSSVFKYGFTSKKNGKGCGLSHAKDMMALWGGEITINSKSGNGTEVILTLKISKTYFKNEIILLDDELLNILSWKGMAKKYNVPFRGYTNSKEFFENLPQDKNSVHIFVDYEFGQENGLEIFDRLKNEGFGHLALATGQSEIVRNGVHQVGKEFPVHLMQ